MSRPPVSLFDVPRTISPQQFFEGVVASELAQVTVPAGSSNERCAFTVHGAGGGTWTIGQKGGVPDVALGDKPGVPFRISVSVADWREILFGHVRDRLLEAAGGRAALEPHYRPERWGRLFMPADQVRQLAAFPGDIALVLEDEDEDETYELLITIGGGTPNRAGAKTTLTIDLDTWIDLVRRELQPQQALMQGRIVVGGDLSYPMSIMGAMMSR